MAFDVQTAMRVAGINPDEIAPEHRQLVLNDLQNRARNDPAFAQRLVQERANDAPQPAAPQPARPSPRMASPMISPLGTAVGMASAMPMQQARHALGMQQDVMDAIEKENYSRVSQGREMRRMQHEKDKEAARMQHEKDVLLMRLRAMRGE
jgi:hypothetical protein